MIIKNLPAGLLFVMLLVLEANAKEWRGITPLKSMRADVERLLGSANKLGRYEIQNERVSIWFSEGPCKVDYGGLAKVNCECVVAKDTVLRIGVTLDSPVKVLSLGIDKAKYQRTPIHAYHSTATYSDFTEGIVYTIRESDDKVTNIDYLPSAKDCEEVVRRQTAAVASNVWQGLAPLRSTRADVERLLGPSISSLGDNYKYVTPENRVDVSYSSDPCKVGASSLVRTPNEVVLNITVSPRRTMLVQSLSLVKDRYIRIQNDHPENWVHYLNSVDGITVDAILNDGREEVVSVIYQPTSRDRDLRCGPNLTGDDKRP